MLKRFIRSASYIIYRKTGLVFQFRNDKVAVQASNVADGNILRAFSFARTSVCTVTETEFVHLAQHSLGTAQCFRFALGQQVQLAHLGRNEQHSRTVLDDINNRRNELKKKQEGKKDEEISTVEKDEVDSLDKKWEELKAQKESLFADYAAHNKVVRQLIDLALLQNGMLKGEALNNFVKRSIDMIK